MRQESGVNLLCGTRFGDNSKCQGNGEHSLALLNPLQQDNPRLLVIRLPLGALASNTSSATVLKGFLQTLMKTLMNFVANFILI